MKLVSVTLAGGNRENVIGGAIRSVQDWVDEVVLINTTEAEKAIEMVRGFCRVPVKVFDLPDHLRQSWCCAGARNFGLDCAHEVGANWAVVVDTDERIHPRKEKVRRLLESAPPDVTHFNAWDTAQSYPKERVFRIPRTGSYQPHPVHEYYEPAQYGVTFPNLRFSEIEKTPEETRQRNEAVLAGARQQLVIEPTNSRWWFYVADAVMAQAKAWFQEHFPGNDKPDPDHESERITEALSAYLRAAELDPQPERRAWAYVCAADCCAILNRYEDGLGWCGRALTTYPGMPEAACVAASLAKEMGRPNDALLWCQIAISLGKYRGCGSSIKRGGFVDQAAFWETPYQLIAKVMRQTGNSKDANFFSSTARDAQAKREAEAR